MKYQAYSLVAATLLATAQAAPVQERSILSDLLTSIVSTVSTGIEDLQLATNAYLHGSVWNYHNLEVTNPPKNLTSKAVSHTITWPKATSWIDWSTYKANGANLGAWLEQEWNLDSYYWDQTAPGFNEEWNWCQSVGFSVCGPILEKRYASFITTADIDKLASVGVNTLRIPTTYAAWVKVPGSWLYSGDQQLYLRQIVNYAIERYSMHVIIGLHSLPGGTNTLQIGEAFGHDGWFFNNTNLAYSLEAVDAVLSFMQATGHLQSLTFAPFNEISDNFAGFGTATGLTTNGTNWALTYLNACLDKIAVIDKRIPIMLQDSFLGETYWSPLLGGSYPTVNVVIDTHIYYFAAAGTYSQYVPYSVCGQGAYVVGDSKFPVFIGEWSLQSMYNNSLANRKAIFDTQRYAWQKYVSGGAFWTGRMNGTDAVDGEGTQRDYWGYERLIDQGVITTQTNASYC